MQRATKKLIHWVFASFLAVAGSAVQAHPINVNLVVNPGFESGDASWNPSGNAGATAAAARLPSSLGMEFQSAPDDRMGTVSQSFSLVSGETYTLDFYLKGNIGAATISFGSSFIADLLIDLDPPGQDGWQFYTGSFTALTDATQSLLFSFNDTQGAGSLFLDDVNLACIDNCSTRINVPEPGSLLLVGAALSALAVYRRRRSA
jgi:Carbohydrate binding domain/PEP-CTERM motif